MQQFTLVRHSGYAVGADPAFEDAVEVCEITEHQKYLIRASGGAVYPAFAIAQAAAVAVNAPGLVASRGYFSSLRVGGAEIYVPRSV